MDTSMVEGSSSRLNVFPLPGILVPLNYNKLEREFFVIRKSQSEETHIRKSKIGNRISA